MGESVLVLSGKGGVGKTSLVAGVGSCLAAMGRRVLCVDLDAGLRNLDIALGLSDRTALDFSDVLSGGASLDQAAVEHPDIEGLFLLNAPMGKGYEAIDGEALTALIRDLGDRYDDVLLDGPAGLGKGIRAAAEGVGRAVVVTTPDEGAVRDAARAAEMMFDMALSQVQLVCSRVRERAIDHGDAANIDDIMDRTGLPLLGVVPEDALVASCQNHAIPLIKRAYGGAGEAFLNIAKRLCGESVPLMRL